MTEQSAKDGHFRFFPDLLTAAISFRRANLSLVSVSLDGTSVPKIYTLCKSQILTVHTHIIICVYGKWVS